MSAHRSTRAPALTGLLLLATLVAGCGGYEATRVPAPPAASGTPTTQTTPPPECGEATRSYAPTGALPAPTALPSGSTMAQIRERGRLIAGVSADTYLMASRNPFNGQIEGFDIDFVKQVARAIFGSDDPRFIQLRVITAADRIPLLQSQVVDIVVRNMTINCTRWEDIAFSAEYYRSGQKLMVRQDLADAGVDSVAELADVRVCAPSGTSSLENITRLAPAAVVVPAGSHTGCLVKFQQGDVDAITGDDTVLAGLAAQDPYAVVPEQETFTDEPYGIGVNAADVDLVRFVNSILERMRTDGSWRASYQQWLQPTLGQGTGQPQPIYGRTP